jgi:hypothetical protein
MSDLTQHPQIGGTGIHVGDCYVWAEIHYLDSPTDYREFLPCNHPRQVPPSSQLVMLDDRAPFPRVLPRWLLAVLILACAVLSLASLIPSF